MTAIEFAEALRALVGVAEDDGLERPAKIVAGTQAADGSGVVREASPDGFAENLAELMARAQAAGLAREDVGALLIDQATAMAECEAE